MDRIAIPEEALPPLLERFYERVRRDPELGPVFAEAIGNWPEHLQKLAAFWSSVMMTTGRYKGNPVAAHLRHAGKLTSVMFERWLALWASTTDEMLAPDQAAAMQAKAARIGESLRLSLRLETPAGRDAYLAKPQPYRSTPEFDEASLPAGLRRAHSTKAGVWGVIRVIEGSLRYGLEDGSEPMLLTPERPGLVRPEELHHVEPIGPFRMKVDFYEAEPRLN